MKKPKLASLATLSVLLLFQKAVHKIFLETFYFKKRGKKTNTTKTKNTNPTSFGTMFYNCKSMNKLQT